MNNFVACFHLTVHHTFVIVITDDLYPEHIEELLRYMKAFIKDVDIKYEQKLSELRGGM